MNIPGIDLSITESIQTLFENYTPLMRFLSAIGDPTLYIVIIIIIAWFYDYKFGAKLAILISLTGLFQSIAKISFRQPRPYEISERIFLRAGRPEMGYGFPSGHATVSAAFSSYSFFKFKWILVSLLVIFSFLTGLSRICLGVHSFFQVSAGWISGIAIIIGYLYLEKKIGNRFTGLNLFYKLIPLLVLSSAIIFLSILVSVDSVSLDQYLWKSEISLPAGLFHGFLSGGILFLHRNEKFTIQTASLKKNLMKALLLVFTIVVFMIFLLLSEQLENRYLACFMIYSDSFFLGFWALFIAPVVFKKLSLR